MDETVDYDVLAKKPCEESASTREILAAVLAHLDFQLIVDWNNRYSEKHSCLTDLTDQEFTRLAGFIIQSTGFRLASSFQKILPRIVGEELKLGITILIGDLKALSFLRLEGQDPFRLAGFWGTRRRQLLAHLGIASGDSE